ncbi:MAG TPA: apolipoprotein N-acyltransferase [Lacipirellula sp.]
MPASPASDDAATQPAKGEGRRTLLLGLLGSLLCYLAHPPASLGWLAWIGPVPWLLLARMPRMPGRRPYLLVWLAGAAYWGATIQWIRLPHWANIFGLFFLAAYLGAYLPVFVGLTRIATHRLRVPLWLAAPIAWTGLEWIRARLLTGFLMGSLAHTQIEYPHVIQIADVFGEYGVTFLIILVAAALAEPLPASIVNTIAAPASGRGPASTPQDATESQTHPRPEAGAAMKWRPIAVAAIALAATLAYGRSRLSDAANPSTPPSAVTVALIQSDMLADWKGTTARDVAVMKQMTQLSREAVRESRQPIDLVVWPETMFRATLHMAEDGYLPPREMFPDGIEETFAATTNYLASLARDLNAAVLVGIDRVLWSKPAADAEPLVPGVPPFAEESFNSSVCVDRTGRIVNTYDKMHLLPFGEYTPLARWIPFFSSISPITGHASPGKGASAMVVDGVSYVPNICYETVLPHLIRRQIAELVQRGEHPDVMVNLTNDAWYWGSSELDMHLASGVFRAVEMRLSLVVAANRGLTAHVDHCGRIVAMTERNVPAKLVTTVALPEYPSRAYPSLFAAYGDWFALVCLLCCTVPAAVAWRDRRTPQRE